jgi:TolB-like protein/tetratricopeptide (TPR) repeat protein
MGVVYAARDERLQRVVALKTIAGVEDETARKRFWREARVAAGVNHPNVCQLHEVGEDGAQLYIVMEMLEGEALSDRLLRGPLTLADTMPVGLGILAALHALHARGVVHRDLKPSNVFLTAHGVKLLDFGLARQCDPELGRSLDAADDLTRSGTIVGTPRYMAPEQVRGGDVDARTDVFAAGAILFETLAGRPAFDGHTVVEVLHAALHENPPALTGPPAVVAADRVIRRALAKSPADRHPSAESMAAELRAAGTTSGSGPAVVARALTRLVVLPLRVLRPDPETDFLAYSLADAVSTSLSGLGPLLVRSSAAAARFAGESPDLKSLAAEADVDLVVMGTLLRAGDHVRVAAQVVETPSGTLVTSHTVQAGLGDLFALEDEMTRRIVEALAPSLAGRAGGPMPAAPAKARAYELYLRGNEVARKLDQIPIARDLYRECVEEDPAFAPAWARLGRCHRFIGKYLEDPAGNRAAAEDAFRRAFQLNPDLPIAHKLYTHIEAETGRAREAIVRLIRHAQNNRNDAELFAGLVHACRYGGLYEASVAAHEEARRLDPGVPTSLEFTLLAMGDHERLAREGGTAIDVEPRVLGLEWMGRHQDARALFASVDLARLPFVFRASLECLGPYLEGLHDETVAAVERAIALHEDPEAFFLFGTILSRIGESTRGLEVLVRAVDGGFAAAPALARDPAFDSLRSEDAFERLSRRAAELREEAATALRDAGGERLLGL